MATIALSLAGQAVGGLFGGPIGATIGRAVGALAGSFVDDALFGTGPTSQVSGADVRLQGSREGGAVPRIYGWNRVAGNVIWATQLERVAAQSSGSKGSNSAASSSDSEDIILANFAVALCDGEVSHLGKIWADGQILDTTGLTIRFYSGAETQLADSLIVAKQGADNSPAYRGVCYLVFEGLPLNQFGNRIPNITVELCRLVGDLEPRVRAVTVIPGATEFGYDPTPRVRLVSPGVTQPENTHLRGDLSDWSLSIDELQTVCPNLEHVALVIAWFGDDLRCGHCQVQPCVENSERSISGTNWSVDGVERSSARVVSTVAGNPAYGGTPSDSAVLAAIADLKARGLKVTIYPLVLMDIPADNTLLDPYTQALGQPAHPWRGRITCDPAIGVANTPDQTAVVSGQVTNFYSANTWNYRRMIMHYAQLSVSAGGVDALVIGSEMRNMTKIRDASTSFPFVDALTSLAANVRGIVGSVTNITYAADWTEYSGYQPIDAPEDKIFHLDPLWADANVDAIGIDNYMPISDWRDEADQADAAHGNIYDLDYLGENVAGGEGYAWFYASQTDRESQIRTPITDGAYGEPWIWRFKDLVGFWSNSHFNRFNGIRDAIPTAWVPQSKPFWFTELGCGAVDKGSNLPSAFTDSKSSEDAKPYFSSGAPDSLIQRQFLRAHMNHWNPSSAVFEESWNPHSNSYTGRMVDQDRIYLWTWDARPFPAFPSMISVWADGANHSNGHWLTGRLGGATADELIGTMAKDFDVQFEQVAASGPLIQGVAVQGASTLRQVIEPILAGTGLSIINTPEGLHCRRQDRRLPIVLEREFLVADNAPLLREKWPASGEAPAQLALSFIDRARDYQEASITAIATDGTSQIVQATNAVFDFAGAREYCENILDHARQSPKTLDFSLPPSFAALETGDAIQIAGRKGPVMIVSQIRDGVHREISTKPVLSNAARAHFDEGHEISMSAAVGPSAPVFALAHLPQKSSGSSTTRLLAGAFANPWPGPVQLTDRVTGGSLGKLTQAAAIGELVESLQGATPHLWDRASNLALSLYGGHLASETEAATLSGANRILLETDAGGWELLGFATAELVGASRYRLSGLLRNLLGAGTGGSAASVGSRAILVSEAVHEIAVDPQKLGEIISLSAFAGSADTAGIDLDLPLDIGLARPLSPIHQHAVRAPASGDVTISWVRRSRSAGDGWGSVDVPLDAAPETYYLSIYDGPTVLRGFTISAPNCVYTATDQLADFGILPDIFSYQIAQISQVYGTGSPAHGDFNG